MPPPLSEIYDISISYGYMIYEHIGENLTKMNTVKLLLTILMGLSLKGCFPPTPVSNGEECVEGAAYLPKCPDLLWSPELTPTPRPTETQAGMRD